LSIGRVGHSEGRISVLSMAKVWVKFDVNQITYGVWLCGEVKGEWVKGPITQTSYMWPAG